MTVPEGAHSIDVTHGKGGSHAEIPIDAVDTSRTVLLIDEWIKILGRADAFFKWINVNKLIFNVLGVWYAFNHIDQHADV